VLSAPLRLPPQAVGRAVHLHINCQLRRSVDRFNICQPGRRAFSGR